MFSDKKLMERMAPLLNKVLIVDPNVATARLLSEVARDAMHAHVWTVPNSERGLKLAANVNPDVIFVEYQADQLDGLQFTRDLRRSNFACRKAAVIMVTSQATTGILLAARDAGVHEFLVKPFSLKDLMRRLEAVTLRKRDWVEAMRYIGPDRRRFNSGDYAGPRKRQDDGPQRSDQEQIQEALKILRSAVLAAETDPVQAIRAMETQVETLCRVANEMGDPGLAHATREFESYLAMTVVNGRALKVGELEASAVELFRYLPPDDRPARLSAA